MPSPFTTPVAQSVPFNADDPAAILAGISSTDVQAAIIEAKNDAVNNDRYPFQAVYNGNANVGRYLEIFDGISSDTVPFIFPENSLIKLVTIQASASSTATFGFFELSNLVTPVFSLSLTAQSEAIFTGLFYAFSASQKLAIRVTAGSVNRPSIRVWVNTNI